ncbi:unnamed protein product [Dovyalis caffra]|uniref:Uncharacterized protein n=1 Tax=Dovyalis caffra TaxID=77055 RepID=A0AAV1S8Q5_9ROSI|nr:unnamed protein product [Dovyalis caffra]
MADKVKAQDDERSNKFVPDCKKGRNAFMPFKGPLLNLIYHPLAATVIRKKDQLLRKFHFVDFIVGQEEVGLDGGSKKDRERTEWFIFVGDL